MRGGWLSGLKTEWPPKADPLLTQAPAERFIEPHMASGDHSFGPRVVDQVPVGVHGALGPPITGIFAIILDLFIR